MTTPSPASRNGRSQRHGSESLRSSRCGRRGRVGFFLCLLFFVSSLAFASPLICIDPGHPSEVGRGTEGRHLTEIQAAWQIAQKLQAVLNARGYKTVLTKQREEQFVTNKDRAMTANHADASLMVRLHCDAEGRTGFAVYAPDRVGHVGGMRGPSAEVIAQSQAAARAFHAAMANSLNGVLQDRGLFSDTATRVGGTQGALTGSIYSRVPVVLIEMCVLTNPRDEAFIASPAGQERMVRALVDGVTAALRTKVSSD